MPVATDAWTHNLAFLDGKAAVRRLAGARCAALECIREGALFRDNNGQWWRACCRADGV